MWLYWNFSVKLGEPSGGADVGDIVECRVSITNDVLAGKVDFVNPALTVHQTSKEIQIKLNRSSFTKGSPHQYLH